MFEYKLEIGGRAGLRSKPLSDAEGFDGVLSWWVTGFFLPKGLGAQYWWLPQFGPRDLERTCRQVAKRSALKFRVPTRVSETLPIGLSITLAGNPIHVLNPEYASAAV